LSRHAERTEELRGTENQTASHLCERHRDPRPPVRRRGRGCIRGRQDQFTRRGEWVNPISRSQEPQGGPWRGRKAKQLDREANQGADLECRRNRQLERRRNSGLCSALLYYLRQLREHDTQPRDAVTGPGNRDWQSGERRRPRSGVLSGHCGRDPGIARGASGRRSHR